MSSNWQKSIEQFYFASKDKDFLELTVPLEIQHDISRLQTLDLICLDRIHDIRIDRVNQSMESSTEFLSLIELLKEEDEYFENKLAIVLLILKANIKRDSVFTKIPELNVNYILSYLFEPQKGNPTSFI